MVLALYAALTAHASPDVARLFNHSLPSESSRRHGSSPHATVLAEIGPVQSTLVMANGSAVFITEAKRVFPSRYMCRYGSRQASMVVHQGKNAFLPSQLLGNEVWVCPLDLGLPPGTCANVHVYREETSLGQITACDDGLPKQQKWDVTACSCNYMGRTAHEQSLLHHMPYWLEYHLKHGIDHFLIYIAPPERSVFPRMIREFLAPYIEVGIVDLIVWHKAPRLTFFESNYCTNHCLWATKGRSRWTTKHDYDEFVAPRLVEQWQDAQFIRRFLLEEMPTSASYTYDRPLYSLWFGTTQEKTVLPYVGSGWALDHYTATKFFYRPECLLVNWVHGVQRFSQECGKPEMTPHHYNADGRGLRHIHYKRAKASKGAMTGTSFLSSADTAGCSRFAHALSPQQLAQLLPVPRSTQVVQDIFRCATMAACAQSCPLIVLAELQGHTYSRATERKLPVPHLQEHGEHVRRVSDMLPVLAKYVRHRYSNRSLQQVVRSLVFNHSATAALGALLPIAY